ncbi:restriction endonuclease subunit S [Nocardioides pocheonensis]|nr:restriction endonuclease subunit S [Nocardioides pocheonensis]
MSTRTLTGGDVARGLGGRSRVSWPLQRSSDLFELRYGKALVASSRRPGRVPVFGTNGQTGTHDTPLFAGPGVIVGRKGAGHLGVHWTDEDYWVIDTAYSLVPSADIDLKFAYYLVNYVGLNHLKHGTSNPSLTREAFGAQYFPVPPLEEQRAIAATLDALDLKIQSNGRSALLLDGLVSLHFQSLLARVTPTYQPLGELATITKGVSYKSAHLQESRTSLVTLKSFDRTGGYKPDGLKPYTGQYKPKQVIAPGELVVAQTDLTQGAEVVGRAVRVPAAPSADVLVASLDLAIVRPSGGIANEYLLGVLTDERFRQHCRSRTTGTTVLHLASDAIPAYVAPVVTSDAQSQYAALVRPLLARLDSLEHENVALAKLRDALLPELLSGRVRISKAAA